MSRREPLAGVEELVVARPGDQHRPVERAQLLDRLHRVAPVRSAHEPGEVGARLGAGQRREHVRVARPLVELRVHQPAERHRRLAQRADPKRSEQRARKRGIARGPQEDGEEARRKLVVGVARREDEAAHQVRVPRDHDLGEAAARVVPDERRPLDAERTDRLGDQVREPGGGEVRLRHRELVRAERHVERDAAEVGREERHDLAPEVRVHQGAVDEDDRLAAAGREGAHPPAARLDLRRLAQRGVPPVPVLVAILGPPWFWGRPPRDDNIQTVCMS